MSYNFHTQQHSAGTSSSSQKMASTVTPSTQSTNINTTMNATSSCTTSKPRAEEYHTVLLAIYSVVLISGTISMSLMMHIMKSSTTSITSIAVLNLIFTHFVFLLTVPFRIYYYATNSWGIGFGWCKVVSVMIHIHMYMSFIFYMIILITRLMTFYNKGEHVASFQKMHALLGSVLVWMVVLVVVPCITYYVYGESKSDKNNSTTVETSCFKFGKHIQDGFKVFNYIISTVVIVAAIAVTALQANALRGLCKKHRQGCTSQQDFGAQLKSLCFALIMVVCFVPYHLFRLYYLECISQLESVNEVFLSLTTFNCLDMLTFIGRRSCYMCLPRQLF